MTTSKLENPTKLFPMFMTADLPATKAFCVDELGWKATHDRPFYLQVRIAGLDGPELAFMSTREGPGAGSPSFPGAGVVVSVPVEDADRHHAALSERGVVVRSAPKLEPWGWRSFAVSDSNGVILDFFPSATSSGRGSRSRAKRARQDRGGAPRQAPGSGPRHRAVRPVVSCVRERA